jgi:hypothetical protein
MKIRRRGAEFFYAGGQTDMTKLIIAFRNIVNASNYPAANAFQGAPFIKPPNAEGFNLVLNSDIMP